MSARLEDRVSPDKLERARRLREGGLSWRHVARMIGSTRDTLRRAFKRKGWATGPQLGDRGWRLIEIPEEKIRRAKELKDRHNYSWPSIARYLGVAETTARRKLSS